MQAKGKTPSHAGQFQLHAGKLSALARGARLADIEPGRKSDERERGMRKLADSLRSARLSDLTPERIQSALALLRDAGKSHQTVNHYRAALRAFVRWAGDKGRLRENPMRGVSGFNAEEDVRHARRCLTDDELARLVLAAECGPAVWGMPGPLRAMAYRLAAATGFRGAELRALTPESFRLDGPRASDQSPSGPATHEQNRRARPSSQSHCRPSVRDLRGLAPRQAVAGGGVPPPSTTTRPRRIRRDLESAGIPLLYETEEGVRPTSIRMRAYYVSALVRSGASIKEVQTLARHAKPQTTLAHYAKVSVRDLRGAVESLPSLPDLDRMPEALAATGTDPEPTATHPATRARRRSDRNPSIGQSLESNRWMIAKPLYGETRIGGSNPPLSASP